MNIIQENIKLVNKDEIKYIAVDMDGTILRNDHEVSVATAEFFKKMQAAGYELILCSGRSTSSMRETARKVGLYDHAGWMISYNGGKAVKINEDGTETVLFKMLFTKEQVNAIYQEIGQQGTNFLGYHDDFIYARENDDVLKLTATISKATAVFDHFDEAYKVLIFGEEQQIKDIYDETAAKVLNLYPDINVFTSSATLIEITPPNANKGLGLKTVFAEIGASPDNLIVFGDQSNDLTMFKYAKYSVAMSNAIAELKKIATTETISNDEDGVKCFLEQLLEL